MTDAMLSLADLQAKGLIKQVMGSVSVHHACLSVYIG
jgi:hypothetical protein